MPIHFGELPVKLPGCVCVCVVVCVACLTLGTVSKTCVL